MNEMKTACAMLTLGIRDPPKVNTSNAGNVKIVPQGDHLPWQHWVQQCVYQPASDSSQENP
jgi:hypothetical protein